MVAGDKKENKRLFILATIVMLIFLGFTVVAYVGMETALTYSWDNAGYYRSFIAYARDFNIKNLFDSLDHSNYNPAPVLLPALLGKLFPATRPAYLLLLTVLYYIPFVYLFTYVAGLFFADREDSARTLFLLLTAVFVASAPCFFAPVLRGYPDICGLLFVLLALVFCYKRDLTELNVKAAIILGLCLYLPFLLRRWYAYTIITLFITLPFLNLRFYRERTAVRGEAKKQAENLLLNFLLAALVAFLLSFVLQKSLVLAILHTDYRVVYAGFQTAFSVAVQRLLQTAGLWILPLFILGLYKSLSQIKSKASALVLFAFFNLVISFFLFTRVQSPDIHHMLSFSLWINLIASFGIIQILHLLRNDPCLRTGFIVLIVSFSVLANEVVFFEHRVFNEKLAFLTESGLFPRRCYPIRVDNLQEYIRLGQTLKQLTRGHKDKIYIVSSNDVLNSDMQFLRDGELSQRVLWTNDVDLRDGFPARLLLAKYIVVTNPLQIHLPAYAQRVISIPRDSIVNQKNIGRAYAKTNYEFMLHNHVQAVIYEKKRPCSLNEVSEFLRSFYEFYPGWKARYEQKVLRNAIYR